MNDKTVAFFTDKTYSCATAHDFHMIPYYPRYYTEDLHRLMKNKVKNLHQAQM